MSKRVGQAKCPYCHYTTTTGGIRWHLEHCSKNPKAKKTKKKDKDVLVLSTCKTCLGSGEVLCDNTFSMIIDRCYACDGKGRVYRTEKELEKEEIQKKILSKTTTKEKLLNYLQGSLETQIICCDDDTLVSLNEIMIKLAKWRFC